MSLLQRIFNKRNNKSDGKPAFEFILPYVLVLLLGFMIADLGTLYLRPYMLPKEAPPKKPQKKIFKTPSSKSVYSPIASRNIFNSEGKIPDTLASLAKKEAGDDLSLIKGVGPKTVEKLNELGIYSFEAILKLTNAELDAVIGSLGNRFKTAKAADWKKQTKVAWANKK